MSNKNIL